MFPAGVGSFFRFTPFLFMTVQLAHDIQQGGNQHYS
jgi:hypothetical protein